MRKNLTLLLYCAFVEVLLYTLVVLPAYSFQIGSSGTGYVRLASQAATAAMLSAQRSATLAAVAPLISSTSAGSVAVRMVAGSVGWPALGIVAGMTLAMLYYNATQTAAIKAAAAGAPPFSIPGYSFPAGINPVLHTDAAFQALNPQYDAYFSSDYMPFPPAPNPATCNFLTLPAGWGGPYSPGQGMTGHCIYLHTKSATATAPTIGSQGAATPQQVQTYIGGLPASDPLSVESNTVPVGSQGTATPADSTASNAVPASALPTSVVPASTVAPTDLVIDANAPVPSGTQTTQTTPQQTTSGTSTTTTTTTTNPNGSTTMTSTTSETEGSVMSCTSGNHEQRTFGSILQDHINVWQGSGLLSALNLLKTLSWPTAIPTYTLNSSLMGTFTLDFSAWSGMLTALRSLIIAVASFVAYRIVFVGSK